MFSDTLTFDLILRGLILSASALFWVVILIRITGLRSLSKMTNFDFVMTIALGSVVAGAAQASDWATFSQAIVAMVGLFITQVIASRLRKKFDPVEDALDNEPLLLMRDGQILHKALKKARVAESDLIAKLREANALEMDKVKAVVLETTGDVSVLHGDELDDRLLKNIRQLD